MSACSPVSGLTSPYYVPACVSLAHALLRPCHLAFAIAEGDARQLMIIVTYLDSSSAAELRGNGETCPQATPNAVFAMQIQDIRGRVQSRIYALIDHES
jgi:hypothetical protein